MCPSWSVAATMYCTAVGVPAQVTRAVSFKHTRLALTFVGPHGTESGTDKTNKLTKLTFHFHIYMLNMKLGFEQNDLFRGIH